MMDTLYIGTAELGKEETLHLPRDEVFEIWHNVYKLHLEEMYGIFRAAQRDIPWCKNIDLKTFTLFVYNHSSRYISYWDQ